MWDRGVAEENRIIGYIQGLGFSQTQALRFIGLSRSAFYYRDHPRAREGVRVPQRDRAYSTRLDRSERDTIVTSLRASSVSVEETYFRDVDTGVAPASLSTYRRVARAEGITMPRTGKRRRRAASEQTASTPQLSADQPRQVVCWDISFLPGPNRGDRYALYAVIDLYSRYICGFSVQPSENEYLAAELFTRIIDDDQRPIRTVHSDNGAAMKSKTLKKLFAKHNIDTSFIRPGVSNDNAFIESFFRTVKYGPAWPGCFTSIEHAQDWITEFVDMYNTQHHHSGLNGYMPHQVYTNTWRTVHEKRQEHFDKLYAANPHRFRHRPVAKRPPAKTTINITNDEDSHTVLVPTSTGILVG